MGIAIYCVGSDAAGVARALSGGTRRVTCTRLPPSVELVVRCAKERAPDLVVLGGLPARAAAVAEALSELDAAANVPVVAWGLDAASAPRLAALGALFARGDDVSLRRACDGLLDAREGRTTRVVPELSDDRLALHGRRVVVAEDDPAVAWYFGDTLRRAGCDVVEVHDGWHALDRVRRDGADVVLADIRMPGLDGLNLCRALRADLTLGDVPVVLLSWKADWLARARDADVGASAFLAKHAVPEEILETVRDALARHADLARRFDVVGPVRGLLGGISPHRLLRLTCAARPSSRMTVQAAGESFEVHLRRGAPVAAVRVSPDGRALYGEDALGALLAVRRGRFLVTVDHTAVRPQMRGSLHQLVARHVAEARLAGPRPVATPSVPVVVAPTETVKLAADADAAPSVPVPLVVRADARDASRRPSRLAGAWRAALRAVGLAAAASLAVALVADSGSPPPRAAAAIAAAPEPPPVRTADPILPRARASRTTAPHPR